MSWRRSLRRRSPAEWGLRVALAALAGWLGYQSVTHSLALALTQGRLEQAYRLAPGDGRIAAALSEKLSGPEATEADRARADRLARAALLRDPTAVPAVATLGVNALLRGDGTSAERLFSYSQRLSRRDLRTQLWAIEDAVARDDIPGALTHYDISLRTKRNAPELLFPVLASAVADPAIQSGLVKTLSGKPLWAAGFIDHVATNGPDPQATAALFHKLRRARVPVSEFASATVINALVSAGHFEDAWAYYASVRGNADRRASRDPRFTMNLERPSAFDWTPVNAPSISTSIQRGDRGGVFDFAVPASVGDMLLRQFQMLPPGEYVLTGRSAGIEQVASASPYWSLTCRGGRELGRVAVPNSAEAGGRFSGRFTVPEGCPVQVLALIARPSNEIGGLTGQIEQVLLAPAR